MANPKVRSTRRYAALSGDAHASAADPAGSQYVHPRRAGPAYVAATFYRRLFELEPALRPMFRGDLEGQGRKLVEAIGMVGALHRFESLRPTLRDLGRRHALYGVRDRHYDTVAAALLWTLAQGLGDAFTPDVRDAWDAAYGQVAAEMKAGASAWKLSPLARTSRSPAVMPAADQSRCIAGRGSSARGRLATSSRAPCRPWRRGPDARSTSLPRLRRSATRVPM